VTDEEAEEALRAARRDLYGVNANRVDPVTLEPRTYLLEVIGPWRPGVSDEA
jgi:hypothetical protein